MVSCPYCGSEELEYYPVFRICKKCGAGFDMSDFLRDEVWKEMDKLQQEEMEKRLKEADS